MDDVKSIIFGTRGRSITDDGQACGGIFYSVRSALKRRSARTALGECLGECAVKYTYGRLMEDAEAFASLMPIKGGTLLCGGGAYETAVALLAASFRGKSLTLCSEPLPTAALESLLDGEGYGLVISSVKPRGLGDGVRLVDLSGFSAAVAGALASPDRMNAPRGDGFVLTFITGERVESYTEESLTFSAGAFADMTSMGQRDVTLCDAHPCSAFGTVCSLLPSLLSGGCVLFCNDEARLWEYMRLTHPTRLCGSEKTARAALEVIEREGPDALALPVTARRIGRKGIVELMGEKSLLAMRRRLSAPRIMRLGGNLRYVAIFGIPRRELEMGFGYHGIVTASVLSGEGYPFAALRESFPKHRCWTLPLGMLADICDVGGGGVGRITLSGGGLRRLADEPLPGGCVPLRFRLDGWDGLSLVTDLRGFVLPNGNIFVR